MYNQLNAGLRLVQEHERTYFHAAKRSSLEDRGVTVSKRSNDGTALVYENRLVRPSGD